MPPPYVDPKFIMPAAGPITGRFGDTGPAYQGHPHLGVDIGCPEGTPVYAPAGGAVVAFGNDGTFGTGVCIDHPGTEWYSLLAHLSSRTVGPGDQVARGQPIGLSGSTGKVTGPHLHWQVCKSAAFPPDATQSTDPLPFTLGGGPPPPSEFVSRAELVQKLQALVDALKAGG